MHLRGLSSIAFTLVELRVLVLPPQNCCVAQWLEPLSCPGFDPQSNLFFLFLQRGLCRNNSRSTKFLKIVVRKWSIYTSGASRFRAPVPMSVIRQLLP